MVLTWRVMPEITRFMFNDIEFDIENQRQWFKTISSDDSCRHWVIYVDGQPIGLIYLDNIDMKCHRSSWGYYIGEEDSRHLGGLILPYFYTYCFSQLGLKKLVAEVMDGNDNIIKIHRLHGYRTVGTYKDHIYKNDRYHDVHVFELHADDWNALHKDPKKHVAKFED